MRSNFNLKPTPCINKEIEELYLKFYPKMKLYSFGKLRSEYWAEEAVSETFFKLLTKLHTKRISFEHIESLHNYVFGILKKEILLIFRNQNKKREDLIDSYESPVFNLHLYKKKAGIFDDPEVLYRLFEYLETDFG